MNKTTDTDTMSRVQGILAEAFQVPLEEIDPGLAFGDLPQWDSMGHMEVIMRLEESFGIEVNADTIANLTSVPAICSYLEENGYANG
jgi:acyl carrier protein